MIDSVKCRQTAIVDRLFNTTRDYSNVLVWPDLDVYNKVFENNYKELSPKYCVVSEQVRQMLKMSKDYVDAVKAPFIIHFAGEKPWQNKELLFADKFWQYLESSGFKDEINDIYKNSWRNKSVKLFGKNILNIFRTKRFYRIKFLGITVFKTANMNSIRLCLLFGVIPIWFEKLKV